MMMFEHDILLLWSVCIIKYDQTSQEFPERVIEIVLNFWLFRFFFASWNTISCGLPSLHASSHRALHRGYLGQAAAAAIASKEETKCQVQTLQQECGWVRCQRVETSPPKKWRGHEKTNQDEPTTNPCLSRTFLNLYRSVLRLIIVLTAEWDGV